MDSDFRLMLEMLADAVVAADRAGRIVYANPAAERLLDWPRGTLEGQPITAIIPAHLRARHTSGFNRYRATWAPRVLGRAIRVAAARKGGMELRIELTLTAYRGGGGNEMYLASLRPLSRQPQVGDRSPSSRLSSDDPVAMLRPLLEETFEPDQLARRTVEVLAAHFQVAFAQLWLHEPESGSLQMLRPSLELAGMERPPIVISLAADRGILAEVARSRQPLRQRDGLNEAALWSGHPGMAGVEALQVLPLVHRGLLLGVLACGGGAPLPEDLTPSLGALVTVVAGALHALGGAAAAAREKATLELVAALREGNRVIALGGSGRPLLREPLRQAVELTGLDGGLVFQQDPEGWVITASWGYRPPLEGTRVPADEEALTAVLARRRSWRSEAYASAPNALAPLRRRGVRAVVAAPCLLRGAIAGVLILDSRKAGRNLTDEDETRAAAFAEQAAVALEIDRLRSTS